MPVASAVSSTSRSHAGQDLRFWEPRVNWTTGQLRRRRPKKKRPRGFWTRWSRTDGERLRDRQARAEKLKTNQTKSWRPPVNVEQGVLTRRTPLSQRKPGILSGWFANLTTRDRRQSTKTTLKRRTPIEDRPLGLLSRWHRTKEEKHRIQEEKLKKRRDRIQKRPELAKVINVEQGVFKRRNPVEERPRGFFTRWFRTPAEIADDEQRRALERVERAYNKGLIGQETYSRLKQELEETHSQSAVSATTSQHTPTGRHVVPTPDTSSVRPAPQARIHVRSLVGNPQSAQPVSPSTSSLHPGSGRPASTVSATSSSAGNAPGTHRDPQSKGKAPEGFPDVNRNTVRGSGGSVSESSSSRSVETVTSIPHPSGRPASTVSAATRNSAGNVPVTHRGALGIDKAQKGPSGVKPNSVRGSGGSVRNLPNARPVSLLASSTMLDVAAPSTISKIEPRGLAGSQFVELEFVHPRQGAAPARPRTLVT